MTAPGQYQLGRIFAATCIAGLAFALIGPRIRAWPASAQTAFYWMSAPAFLLGVGIPAIVFWRQAKVHQQAGSLLLRARPDFRLRCMQALPWVFGVLGLTYFGMANWLFSEGVVPKGSPVPFTVGRIFGTLLMAELAWLTIARPVEFREHGALITRFALLRWETISSVRWSEKLSRVFVVANHHTFDFPLTADELAVLEPILEQKLPQPHDRLRA